MVNKRYKLSQLFAFFSLKWRPWTKRVPKSKLGQLKRSPVGPIYPKGDPFGNNAMWSLFGCPFAAQQPAFQTLVGRRNWGKMEEPGLTFCRARFAIVLWTFCDFFAIFLPLALDQHLIAACQCQNKSPAHFLLQKIAIFQSQFLKCGAKKDQMKKMKIFKCQFLNFFNAANPKK